MISGSFDISKYDAVVFDCDGVLWRADTPVPGAQEALKRLMDQGKKVFFATNNASKTTEEHVERLVHLGFPCEEGSFFCTASLAGAFLSSHGVLPDDRKRVYYIGMSGLGEEMRRCGIPCRGIEDNDADAVKVLRSQTIYDVEPLADEYGAVVVGFDRHFSYAKLAIASLLIRSSPHVLFIATNPDTTFPMGEGLEGPGAGSLVQAVATAVGRKPDIVLGKPEPRMMKTILDQHALDPRRVLMVGDRLETDIAFGANAGADTLLVLSGVSSEESVANIAEGDPKPTFVLPSVAHMFKD
jgi:phosphoglycolate/pyridoxal phosphate phosphatase family enzyme